MLVAITDIRVGKRLRSLRENAVADLMSSISELGLQTPISVKPGIAKGENGGDKAAFDLIAGRHRLEACKRLGWEEIDASISQLSDTECELWEIDENLSMGARDLGHPVKSTGSSVSIPRRESGPLINYGRV